MLDVAVVEGRDRRVEVVAETRAARRVEKGRSLRGGEAREEIPFLATRKSLCAGWFLATWRASSVQWFVSMASAESSLSSRFNPAL